MKLDWEINEFRVLKAKVGEVTYYVTPGVTSLWKPSKRFIAFDGKVEAEGAVDGMSLANAIAWCERDAERPEECPAPKPPSAQAPEPQSVEERLLRCEAECREQRSRMDACEHRTIGLYVPEWKERLYSITQRISELETWLGSKKYAPEDNLASKTWLKLVQLTNRLEKLEAK